MRDRDALAADRIRFAVCGRGAQHFLSSAARAGIRVNRIQAEEQCVAASAAGADFPRLCRIAERGGWKLTVLSRHGPGRMLERLFHRPGLAAGAVCFVILVQWLSGFLWCMDLNGVEDETALRGSLARYGIREGVRLDEKTLAAAQQAMNLEEDSFGWLSLNFAGGCLFVESTPRQTAEVRGEDANTELCAKAAGLGLAVDVQSVFSQVEPGQYVAQGQLLAAASRPDRSGAPVSQSAAGKVLARVRKSCTAFIPLKRTATILTGRVWETQEICVLGHLFEYRGDEGTEETFPSGAKQTSRWIPLTLGRFALPASVYEVSYWECAEDTVILDAQDAAALARRSCRLALLKEFPDAVVKTEIPQIQEQENGVFCTVTYEFCADIAMSVPEQSKDEKKKS